MTPSGHDVGVGLELIHGEPTALALHHGSQDLLDIDELEHGLEVHEGEVDDHPKRLSETISSYMVHIVLYRIILYRILFYTILYQNMYTSNIIVRILKDII